MNALQEEGRSQLEMEQKQEQEHLTLFSTLVQKCSSHLLHVSLNTDRYSRTIKKKVVSCIASLVRRAHARCMSLENILPCHVSYKIVNTPFSAQVFPMSFSILPQWFRRTGTMMRKDDIESSIICNLYDTHDDRGTVFTVEKEGRKHTFTASLSSSSPILEAILTGKPGSTFRYNYPMGVDVTEFFSLILSTEKSEEQEEGKGKLTLLHLLPFIFITFLHAEPYPADSVYVDLLEDETFDVSTMFPNEKF
jgi:hypothetical protein